MIKPFETVKNWQYYCKTLKCLSKRALMSSQPHRLVPLANGMSQLAMTLTLLMIAVILPMLAQLR